MMEQYRSAQGDQQMAQELMRPQYAQNSGALGALAMIAQTYAGKRMRKKADESASEYAGRIFTEEQRIEAQRKAEEEAKITRERNEELARADALRAYEASREDARLAREDERWNKSFALQERSLNATIENQRASRGGGGYMLSPDQAEANGLPRGNYWVDASGKPSPIQAPQAAPKTPEEQARADAMAKELPAVVDARNAIQRYRDLVEKYGTEQMPGPIKRQLETAHAAARDGVRVMAAAGTLNLGELPIMDQRLAPAANDLAWFGGNPGAGSILSQIDENLLMLAEKEARIRGISVEQLMADREAQAASQSQPPAQPQRTNQGGPPTPAMANAAPKPWTPPQGWSIPGAR